MDLTINLFKVLKSFLLVLNQREKTSVHQPIKKLKKFFRKRLPDFGKILNAFITYLDNMPDELNEPTAKKSKKSKESKKDKENAPPSKLIIQKLQAKSRRLPDLVFSFEEFDRELITYAENTKDKKVRKMEALKIRDISGNN